MQGQLSDILRAYHTHTHTDESKHTTRKYPCIQAVGRFPSVNEVGSPIFIAWLQLFRRSASQDIKLVWPASLAS